MTTRDGNDPIVRALAETREVAPPAELDRRVRDLLAIPPCVAQTGFRPVLATGVAVAALLALVWFVAASLAGAGAAEMAPVIAVFIAWVYLAVSAAVTLPLLLIARDRSREEMRT